MEEKVRYLVCRLSSAANEKYADYLELELANNWVENSMLSVVRGRNYINLEIIQGGGEGRED